MKLNSPAAAAAAADIQGAVVEKGIEVMGKMVDKQLQIIDEAQEKAESFLKKEVWSTYAVQLCIQVLDCSRVQHLSFFFMKERDVSLTQNHSL